jgi:hypothetical protein
MDLLPPNRVENTGLDPAKKYVLFPCDPAEQRKRYHLIQAAVAERVAAVYDRVAKTAKS